MSPNRPINVPGAPYRSRGIEANWDTAGARGCGKNEDRGARGVTSQGLDPDWRLRLAAFAEAERQLSCEPFADALMDSLRRFAGGRLLPHDDLTLVVVDLPGAGSAVAGAPPAVGIVI